MSRRTTLLFIALFILLSLVTALRHEMWRDELQAWLLAKEHASFTELAQAVRYDKHPLAWYVVLFLLSRLTGSPLAMQLFHVGLAAFSAWLVLRFAPFSPVQKVLLIFGYYLFFEYNVISRNYALGILSLFLFCFSYAGKRKIPLGWGACLFVLANTSVYGLIFAAAASGAVIADVLTEKSLRRQWTTFVALMLMGLGVALSAWCLRPIPDSSWDQFSRLHRSFNAGLASKVLWTVPKAYLQVPRPTFHFWNTHILGNGPSTLAINASLALLVLIFSALVIWRRRSALIFFVLSTSGTLAWLYIASVGFVRHQGHLFLAFVAAVWLARGSPDPIKASSAVKERRPEGILVFSFVLTLIFAVQAVGGLFAVGMDIVYPFSQAKATARYIKQKGYRDLPIVGEMDYLMTPVSGYLGRKIYFVRGERPGSYVKWDMRRFEDVSPEVILQRAEQFSRKEKKDCLILLNFHLDPALEQPGHLVKLMATSRAITGSEVYRLYLMKYPGPSQPATTRPKLP
ncbi:MAG: hypothetical protein QHH14_07125 [Clostridiales bacterium]|nr:hypothetical protein [Clostridiales bacterium]